MSNKQVAQSTNLTSGFLLTEVNVLETMRIHKTIEILRGLFSSKSNGSKKIAMTLVSELLAYSKGSSLQKGLEPSQRQNRQIYS